MFMASRKGLYVEKTFTILLYQLLELRIFIEEFYENFSLSDTAKNNYALNNTSWILAAEEKKHINFYRQWVKEAEPEKDYIIENGVFSQFEFQLINLKQSLSSYGIYTAGQLIAKAIDIQNNLIFLITNIRDTLKTDRNFPMNHVLDAILKEEQKFLASLLPFRRLS